MAKKSLDNSAARSRSGSITRHPAFPAIVALWFTALLGFGGLLLPVALLERLVEVSRVASLVPAAAPPLGFTARLIVAAALGTAGAVLGFKIGRRVTGAGSRDEAELDTAFSVATDLGAQEKSGDEESTNRLRRRRALTIADLGPEAESIGPADEPRYADAPVSTPPLAQEVEPPVTDSSPPEPGFQEWRRSADVIVESETIDIPVVEAVAESIESPLAVEAEPEEAETFGTPDSPEPEPEIEAAWAPAPKPSLPSAALDDLDITQLVERFAQTVQRRREWLASTRQTGPSSAQGPDHEAGSPAPHTAAAAPPPVEEAPAVHRPPFFDWVHHLNAEARDGSAAKGFSVPLHSAAFVSPAPAPKEDEEEPDPETDIEVDDAYGSLIEMKNPFAPTRSDFIRIDESEEEVEGEIAREAAPERADTLGTDESLRAALAKLQQLSGNP